MAATDPNLSSFIWSVADLLRGDYKQSDYGKVILPFTVLRRLDCVLEATKPAVLKELEKRKTAGINPEPFLLKKAEQHFYNASPLDMKRLMGDQDHIKENLFSYLQGFSPAVRNIFESFEFHTQVDRLAKAGLLYLVTEKFANIDLHPEVVSNAQMGAVFEELIRKFAEISNETAGEHFTPREVIRLMVNLIFIEDDEALAKPGIVRSIYDPTAGTGGMLSVAGEHLAELNPGAQLAMFGQELNPESYAICKADMLIKGQPVDNIIFGNTLSADGLPAKKFDYMLSNPPFGVEWKKIEKEIRREADQEGFNGRFGPGLPRVSDGSLLFLLHLISKMQPVVDGRGGSRFGIVLNGSPLFTGGAGSGESEIRRYVLENDLVEAIIALPTDMFYNTGISTYVWIVSNRKPANRKGKVHLIDASSYWQKMRKSLGSKRKELSDEQIDEITRLFGDAKKVTKKGVPISRIFRNEDFGYRTISVERPVRDEAGKVVLGAKDTTYVLDFVNEAEDVLAAFKTYHATAELANVTDPNLVYNIRAKLDAAGHYDDTEVDRVVAVELRPNAKQSELVAAVEPVVDRLHRLYKAAQASLKAAVEKKDAAAEQAAKDELDALRMFQSDMGSFVRLYTYLSQIFDYGNTAIEKRGIFYKHVLRLLEFGREREGIDLSKVVLTHHTLRSRGKQTMLLGEGENPKLEPLTEVGGGALQEKEKSLLERDHREGKRPVRG